MSNNNHISPVTTILCLALSVDNIIKTIPATYTHTHTIHSLTIYPLFTIDTSYYPATQTSKVTLIDDNFLPALPY